MTTLPPKYHKIAPDQEVVILAILDSRRDLEEVPVQRAIER